MPIFLPLLIAGFGIVALAATSKKEGRPGQRPETKPDAEELGLTFEAGTPVIPYIPWEGDVEPDAPRVPAEIEEINLSRSITVLPNGQPNQPISRTTIIGTLPLDQHASAIVRACLSYVEDRGPGATEVFGSRYKSRAFPRSWRVNVDDRGNATIISEDPGWRDVACPPHYELRRGVARLEDWDGRDLMTKGNIALEYDAGALVIRSSVASTIFLEEERNGGPGTEQAQSYQLEVHGVVIWAA